MLSRPELPIRNYTKKWAVRLNVFDALPQFIKDGDPPLREGAAVGRRLDPLWAPVADARQDKSRSPMDLDMAGCEVASRSAALPMLPA